MFGVEEIQSLNELELAVYEYVMLHKNAVSYMRIRELAAEAHVSTTTVIRFCKKMGCDGYAEFKLRMKEYIGFKQVAPLSEDFSEIRTFLTAVRQTLSKKSWKKRQRLSRKRNGLYLSALEIRGM